MKSPNKQGNINVPRNSNLAKWLWKIRRDYSQLQEGNKQNHLKHQQEMKEESFTTKQKHKEMKDLK